MRLELFNDTPAVSFGQTLLYPEHETLRDKLLMLAAGRLRRPLYADTLLGADAHPSGSLSPQTRSWFLLFDFHRLFLYDDPATADAPRLQSIIRFIMDDYPIKVIGSSAFGINQYLFKFFYSLETLDLLPRLWDYDHPGRVVILDFLTAEVRIAEGLTHPHVQVPQPDIIMAFDRAPFRLSGEQPILGDRVSGPSWRTGEVPQTKGLISRDVGIIREERDVVSETFLPGAVARVAWRRGLGEDTCGGISFRGDEAKMVARCETLERFHVAFLRHDEPSVYGSYSELCDVAVDPLSLFYRITGPEPNSARISYDDSIINFSEYDASTPLHWTKAYNYQLAKEVLVPAQEVWFDTDQLPNEHNFIISSTNACALGSCAEEAALFAILEAVERDAYLTTWYLQRRCEQIVVTSIDFEPFQLLWERVKTTFPNYRVHLFDITTDLTIPVVAGIAVREWGTGPRTLHAAAARPLAERALFAALKDLSAALRHDIQVYEPQRYREALERPELITKPEDHRAFFALDETFERLAFFDFGATPRLNAQELNERYGNRPQTSYQLRKVVEKMIRKLNERGIPVLLKDMTHPVLEGRNLRCFKAITPGLYPLWFGHNCARFSVTERLKELAQRFTARTPLNDSDFCLDVHPFS